MRLAVAMECKVTKSIVPVVAFVSASWLAPLSIAPAVAEGKVQRDPNEKICQVIKPTGSRLGGKKICATRAEWEEQKRLDREATEKAQTQLCVINPMTGKCGN